MGEAIRSAGGKLKSFSFEEHILFAEINEVGEVAVKPSLLCMEIKPGSNVRAKRRKGAITSPKHQEYEKGNKAATKSQSLFFVKSNIAGITKLANTAYEGRPLCVDAHPNDTLMDAISKDGRFRENFKLLEDNDARSAVSLDYKVSEYSRQTFIMMKDRKRKLRSGNEATSSEAENVISRKQTVYSSIPSKVTAPFTEEIGKTMICDARNSALETLIKPGVEKAALDKNLHRMVQNFGKTASSAMPARMLPRFTEATKSVGFIECGYVTGTCFLLSKNYLITAQHVINNINKKRAESTDGELYRKISIYFKFLYPSKYGSCSAEMDETKIFSGQGGLDYAICHIKWVDSAVANLEPLGPFVRSVLPCSGLVILVGHPDSKEKSIEPCHIMPSYNWHATLCKRASEAEGYCDQHPEECSIYNGESVRCVHIHKHRYLQGHHPDQIPYDTSFFEGSSGSPVLNLDGHIVALHTQGYPFYQSGKEVSLMEFGLTFGAIFRDVKERFGERGAKFFFPNICG